MCPKNWMSFSIVCCLSKWHSYLWVRKGYTTNPCATIQNRNKIYYLQPYSLYSHLFNAIFWRFFCGLISQHGYSKLRADFGCQWNLFSRIVGMIRYIVHTRIPQISCISLACARVCTSIYRITDGYLGNYQTEIWAEDTRTAEQAHIPEWSISHSFNFHYAFVCALFVCYATPPMLFSHFSFRINTSIFFQWNLLHTPGHSHHLCVPFLPSFLSQYHINKLENSWVATCRLWAVRKRGMRAEKIVLLKI